MVEGNKIIAELKNSHFNIREIYSTSPEAIKGIAMEPQLITEKDLRKISFLQSPKDAVAIVEIPEQKLLQNIKFQLVLDGIQDPGNLGSMIRLCDWFGIEQIICSEDTVDLYNPKVIQASKGSFARVNVFYTDLFTYLKNTEAVNIGTDMEGDNFYQVDFPSHINLVMGNEGNGIRSEIVELMARKITVPRFGTKQSTESLNVSMAAGIILGQIFSKK